MFDILVLFMLTLASPLLTVHFAAVSAFRTGWHYMHRSPAPRWVRRVVLGPLVLGAFAARIPQGFLVVMRPVYTKLAGAVAVQ